MSHAFVPLALVATVALGAAPLAAQIGTAPRHLTNGWGDASAELPLGKTQSRWQQVYDRSALPAGLMLGMPILTVEFRRGPNSATYSAGALSFELSSYNVPFDSSGMSQTFATNRAAGTGGITFAKKSLNLPPTTFGNPSNTFVTVPLDAPHVFTGPHLLIETVTDGPAPSQPTGWLVDQGVNGAAGAAVTWGFPCGPGLNAISSNSTNQYLPGSTLNVTLTTGGSLTLLRKTAICAFGISVTGVFPIDLTAIGWPQGCMLYVDPLATLTTTLGAYGGGVSVPTPNDPNLSGKALYAQFVMVDQNAGFAPLAASGGHVLRFGPRTANHGASTYRADDNLDTVGTSLDTGRVVVTRFR
jgi:hypothetical protein